MAPTRTSRHIVVREHEALAGLDAAEQNDLKHFALASLTEGDGERVRPVLTLRDDRLYARNHVGVIETQRGTVVEILPKVELAGGGADEADNRNVFLEMLRAYRALRFAQFDQASIKALREFTMLDVFVRLFLNDLMGLTQRGLARHYQETEDNLPCLRGRIQFAQHIRLNVANGARFYVAFDEFTADRPVNRLIHTTIHRLRARTHPDNWQLLHQLRLCFADVPRSERPEVDWRRRRIDRSMPHYEKVMAWVRLFLFGHGLATLSGKHVNRALLFPMEEVFEDFVVDAFKRHQSRYRVRAQGPQRTFAQIDGRQVFTMKPDIALMQGESVRFVLDAKWKAIDATTGEPRHDIAQSDVYQLYSYGRKFGCRTVALIYPRTAKFQHPLRYEFDDEVNDVPLALWCFPFNVVDPHGSVRRILARLHGTASPAAKAAA